MPPPWTSRSDIWEFSAEAELNTNMEPDLLNANEVKSSSGAQNEEESHTIVERRIAYQVYEMHSAGRWPRLEVRAIEQFFTTQDDTTAITKETQIGQCVAILFNRANALNNSFEITTQDLPVQLRMFVTCAFKRSGRLKPDFVGPDFGHFNQGQIKVSSDHHRDIVGEHSFLLIEEIKVNAQYRRRGIATQMIEEIYKDALDLMPSIKFVASWPCAGDADLTDMGIPCGAFAPGVGQRRAEDFHEALGFCRLGHTVWWVRALARDEGEGSSDSSACSSGAMDVTMA